MKKAAKKQTKKQSKKGAKKEEEQQPEKKERMNKKNNHPEPDYSLYKEKLATNKNKKYLFDAYKQDPDCFAVNKSIIRAKFKKNFKGKQRYEALTGKQDLMDKDIWKISGNNAVFAIQMNVIFHNMLECYAGKIHFGGTANSGILQYLIEPKFIRLTQLSIRSNRINNIEALAFLDAPMLLILDLGGNHISSFHVFHKFHHVHLEHLSVFRNYQPQLKLDRLYTGKSLKECVIPPYDAGMWWRQESSTELQADMTIYFKLQRGRQKRAQNVFMQRTLQQYQRELYNPPAGFAGRPALPSLKNRIFSQKLHMKLWQKFRPKMDDN